jgi:hypothetical protein
MGKKKANTETVAEEDDPVESEDHTQTMSARSWICVW